MNRRWTASPRTEGYRACPANAPVGRLEGRTRTSATSSARKSASHHDPRRLRRRHAGNAGQPLRWTRLARGAGTGGDPDRPAPGHAFVDRGYRGHGVATVKVFISGARRGVTRTVAKLLQRRSAIEPMIGHMKTDGRLTWCPLKGTTGGALFAVLCGCAS